METNENRDVRESDERFPFSSFFFFFFFFTLSPFVDEDLIRVWDTVPDVKTRFSSMKTSDEFNEKFPTNFMSDADFAGIDSVSRNVHTTRPPFRR